jgi:thioredoxin 1
MSNKERFQDLIQGDEPVLVDFYAEWCGPCKVMAPMLAQFSQKMQGKVRVLKIDVDRNPAAAAAYKIQGVPTLILFRKGKVEWHQSGVVPVPQLEKVVQPFINKP